MTGISVIQNHIPRLVHTYSNSTIGIGSEITERNRFTWTSLQAVVAIVIKMVCSCQVYTICTEQISTTIAIGVNSDIIERNPSAWINLQAGLTIVIKIVCAGKSRTVCAG